MAISTQRRDRYRRIADRARAIPADHGLREWRVYLEVVTWSGEHTGENSGVVISTELTVHGGQPPRVRQLNDEQLALANLGTGILDIGPLTPAHSEGGVDVQALLGSAAAVGDEVRLRITGPEGTAYYSIDSLRTDRALRVMVRAKPRGKTQD